MKTKYESNRGHTITVSERFVSIVGRSGVQLDPQCISVVGGFKAKLRAAADPLAFLNAETYFSWEQVA